MYQHTKDLQAWQLEEVRNVSELKTKWVETQDTGAATHLLANEAAMDMKSLEGCVKVLESQGEFVVDHQVEDHYHWENMFNGHRLTKEEKMSSFQGCLDTHMCTQHSLCASINKGY